MINWAKTAFVFPGQGAQVVGMGKDIAEKYPAARQTFEQADEVLGYQLSDLCFNGPQTDLDNTLYTQPALYTCGMALLRALQTELPNAAPAAVAGHSLGELTALAAAGALPFEDGLRLVAERGRLMSEAGEAHPGAMAALLGLDADAVRAVCALAAAETASILVLANDNCPGQIVISGENTALERGLVLAKEAGARRAVKLAVSIAAHSPLMEPVAERFRQAIAAVPFQQWSTPIIANVTSSSLVDVDAVRHELAIQLTSPVRWTESIRTLLDRGIDTFVELGPKDVLTGLLRRISDTAFGFSVNSIEGLNAFVQAAHS